MCEQTMETLYKLANCLARGAIVFEGLSEKCIYRVNREGEALCHHLHRVVGECEPTSCALGTITEEEFEKFQKKIDAFK